MYTWCYKNASGKVFPEGVEIPSGYDVGTKQKSVFQYEGKWYVLTNVSLEGLGAVSGDANIILDENEPPRIFPRPWDICPRLWEFSVEALQKSAEFSLRSHG